jgi:hypothetical protein
MPESSFVSDQLGTITFSHVQTPNVMGYVRAAAWHNSLARLGLHAPFFLVHDLGVLLTQGATQGLPQIGPRAHLFARVQLTENITGLLRQYAQLLRYICNSDVVAKSSSWSLSDEIVSVILVKILKGLFSTAPQGAFLSSREMLPLEPNLYEQDIAQAYSRISDLATLHNFLQHLIKNQLQILTAIEQIDLDTLRILGLFQEGGSTDFLDLFHVFSSTEANDIINFSLELLPSILEAKRSHGAQTFSMDGYASVERRGNLDNILLTEFAYDDILFEQKFIDNELFFYGRERQKEQEQRLHYIIVDASASMRGVRSVFARGLALTLIKKMSLKREKAYVRFFDSRLYDLVKMEGDSLGVPYLLCFKSEHGRNYTKVFSQLIPELTRLKKEEKRSITLYFLTHGQCHVPVPIMESLERIASLYGVFILPSEDMQLDYLSLLDHYHIVDEDTLSSRKDRVDKALTIIDEASPNSTR